MIHSAELAWEQYFRKHGNEPLIIYYEDFFRDVGQQLRRLINHLGGLPAKRTKIDAGTTFEIQRDEKTYSLRERFVQDLTRLGTNNLTLEMGKHLDRWVDFFL